MIKNKSINVNSISYLSYRIFKGWVNLVYPFFRNSRPRYGKARLQMGFKVYLSLIFLISILSASLTFAILIFLRMYIPMLLPPFFSAYPFSILFLALLPIASFFGIFFGGLQYPFIRAKKFRNRIEESLPFATSYLSVMSSTNISPDSILRAAIDKNPDDPFSDEMKFLIKKIDMIGMDFYSAIDEEIKISVSPIYANLLKGLAITLKRGGSLKKYFVAMSKQLLEKRNLKFKQYSNMTQLLAHMHILMFTIFPLLLIIMLSIMAVVGGSLGGMSISFILNLMGFIGIPMLGIMFLFMIDAIQPKD